MLMCVVLYCVALRCVVLCCDCPCASFLQDVARAIDWVHSSGEMHAEVARDPTRYLNPNPDLPVLLQRFRDDNKKLFLLTNSSFYFANSVLGRLLGENWQRALANTRR